MKVWLHEDNAGFLFLARHADDDEPDSPVGLAVCIDDPQPGLFAADALCFAEGPDLSADELVDYLDGMGWLGFTVLDAADQLHDAPTTAVYDTTDSGVATMWLPQDPRTGTASSRYLGSEA